MQKIRAASIGEAFYKNADFKLPATLRSTLKDWTDYEIELIEGEIMYLDIFITDYWVKLEFDDNSDVEDAILKSYYSYWERMANDMEMPEFYSDMKDRFSGYSAALETPHQQGPIFVLGMSFAKYCGYEEELAIVVAGSLLFDGISDAKVNVLKNIKKEYEIIL